MTNIEPNYPAFDTAKQTDAERIAALEAQVDNLTRLVETLTERFNAIEPIIYNGQRSVISIETPDYLKPPWIIT